MEEIIKRVNNVEKWIKGYHYLLSDRDLGMIHILLTGYKIQEKRIKELKDEIKMQKYELKHLHKFIGEKI